MIPTPQSKPYDLEERTFQFAQRVRALVKRLPRTLSNWEDGKQLVRASGSVGANYIEANESLGTKDFLMRIKISRKEARESRFWLRLLDLEGRSELEPERTELLQESIELTRILSAIHNKRSG
ncbi:MAG TPA: four helix bundle protein [Gemmataceae bacterium]|jgi:four helix bundle protein